MATNGKYGFRADGSELLTQWDTILYHLYTTGERITQWQASRDFGFTDLAGIVKRLEEHHGITLHRRRIEVTTRYGATTFINEYWLDPADRDTALATWDVKTAVRLQGGKI